MCRYCLIFLCCLAGYSSHAQEDFDFSAYLWEAPLQGFSQADYAHSTAKLLDFLQKHTHFKLIPGKRGKVALKVDTASGPGLSTPMSLVLALIEQLERVGFKPENIIILDQEEATLREAGFLPPLSQKSPRGSFFKDKYPVYALDTQKYYNPKWYYESALPSRNQWLWRLTSWSQISDTLAEARKSYLPYPLLFEVDFWINLPVVTDSTALGVNGALANATLWNIGNNKRFWQSPAYAPVATAEIAAIPELQETWGFTILSLERYQYLGGPAFNSLYSTSEKRIFLSKNAPALDYFMYTRINKHRHAQNLPLIEPVPPLFEFAQSLGLGAYKDIRIGVVD